MSDDEQMKADELIIDSYIGIITYKKEYMIFHDNELHEYIWVCGIFTKWNQESNTVPNNQLDIFPLLCWSRGMSEETNNLL